MPKFLDPPVVIVPSGADAWVDVDLSAHIDADAIGVFFIARPLVGPFNLGWRKKGANPLTNDRSASTVRYATMCGMFVGVDVNQVCELYVDSTADLDLYLMGYAVAGEGEFFTDALDVTPGTTGSFEDVDITASTTGTPKCVFLEIDTNGERDRLTVRVKGSSDSDDGIVRYHGGLAIGCDANGVFQVDIERSTTDVYVLGYLTDNVTVNLDAVEDDPVAEDAWEVLSDISPDVGAAYSLLAGGISNNMGVKPNGFAPAITGKGSGESQSCLITGAPSGLVQGWRSTLSDHIYQILRFQEPAGGGTAVALDDLAQTQSLDPLATTQQYSTTFTALDQGQGLDAFTLTQAHNVVLTALDAPQTLATLAATTAANIALDPLHQIQSVEAFALAQHYLADFGALAQSQTVANIGITVAGSVVLLDLQQIQSMEALAVTQQYVVDFGALDQAQVLAALPVGNIITADFGPLDQSQAIDNVAVIQQAVVVLNALAQGHTLDGVNVTQEGVVTIADVAQLQDLAGIDITQFYNMSLLDLSQLSTLDALPLAVGEVVTPPERVLVFRHQGNVVILGH